MKTITLTFFVCCLMILLCAGCGVVSPDQINEPDANNELGREIINADTSDDFNFSINFGTYGKNCIDTYNSTFTKDLVSDGTETIDFVIPADKMQEFYMAFEEYKISELPDDINIAAKSSMGKSQTMIASFNRNYSITYTYKEKTRTIRCNDSGPWDAENGPPDTRNRLVDFVSLIEEYIYSTEEYQNMSPSVGGYH